LLHLFFSPLLDPLVVVQLLVIHRYLILRLIAVYTQATIDVANTPSRCIFNRLVFAILGVYSIQLIAQFEIFLNPVFCLKYFATIMSFVQFSLSFSPSARLLRRLGVVQYI